MVEPGYVGAVVECEGDGGRSLGMGAEAWNVLGDAGGLGIGSDDLVDPLEVSSLPVPRFLIGLNRTPFKSSP